MASIEKGADNTQPAAGSGWETTVHLNFANRPLHDASQGGRSKGQAGEASHHRHTNTQLQPINRSTKGAISPPVPNRTRARGLVKVSSNSKVGVPERTVRFRRTNRSWGKERSKQWPL